MNNKVCLCWVMGGGPGTRWFFFKPGLHISRPLSVQCTSAEKNEYLFLNMMFVANCHPHVIVLYITQKCQRAGDALVFKSLVYWSIWEIGNGVRVLFPWNRL